MFLASGTFAIAVMCEKWILHVLNENDSAETDWQSELRIKWANMPDECRKSNGWAKWDDLSEEERMESRLYMEWLKDILKEKAKVLRLPFFCRGYSGWFYSPLGLDTLHMRVALVRYNGRMIFVLAVACSIPFESVCLHHICINFSSPYLYCFSYLFVCV